MSDTARAEDRALLRSSSIMAVGTILSRITGLFRNFVIASTDVDKGKELFDSFCEDCHPGGEEDVGPSLIAEPHSPAHLRQQIREGSGKMRPFSEKRLPGEDLEALLAYLQTINAVK